MKKSLVLLIALSGGAIAEDTASSTTFTLHEVTFTAPDAGALHSAYSTAAEAIAANMYLTGQKYFTNSTKGTTYSGIFLDSGAGLKFNHSINVTVDYLYIASGIKIKASKESKENQLNWSDTTATRRLVVNSWVDINADYGTSIDVSGMTDGALYLNTAGALTLQYTDDTEKIVEYTLSDAVKVYATITDAATERTLLTGDFSNWAGTVCLMTADNEVYIGTGYTWEATAEGLKIVAAPIPEPATATLSLLALVGLAARRRRR